MKNSLEPHTVNDSRRTTDKTNTGNRLSRIAPIDSHDRHVCRLLRLLVIQSTDVNVFSHCNNSYFGHFFFS